MSSPARYTPLLACFKLVASSHLNSCSIATCPSLLVLAVPRDDPFDVGEHALQSPRPVLIIQVAVHERHVTCSMLSMLIVRDKDEVEDINK